MDRDKFNAMMLRSEAELAKIRQEIEQIKSQTASSGGGAGGSGQVVEEYIRAFPGANPGPDKAEDIDYEQITDQAGTGMQYGFDVVEVQRVNLQPGDTLMVTVKNDDLSQASVDGLRAQLERVFPSNKVFVFAMGTNDDVKISVVSQSEKSYCDDCNCGKKETPEPEDEHMKRLAEHAKG